MIKLLLKVAPVLHYSALQLVNLHHTSPGPECLIMAVKAVCCLFGRRLYLITTEVPLEHIAVLHLMG